MLTERGIELPVAGQSTTTPQTRADEGLAVQKRIVGDEKVDAMYANASEDVAHFQRQPPRPPFTEEPRMSTWLITGCSTGLGRALAEKAIASGHNVVATARNASKVADLVDAAPERVLALALDVTVPEQVSAAVQEAETRFGVVDVLVNNAGYGYRAAVEEGDDAEVRMLFDTHFFGTVATIKAVLPGMRARRRGAIVNVSSIGAQLTPVGSGYYASVKSAVEGLSGSLRGELAPLGISVTIVEPGAFRTDFAGRSLTQSATTIDDYAATAGKRRKEHDTVHGTQAGDPAKAAEAIIAAVEAADTPAFLLLGSDALANYRRIADTRAAEINTWQKLSISTDFDN